MSDHKDAVAFGRGEMRLEMRLYALTPPVAGVA